MDRVAENWARLQDRLAAAAGRAGRPAREIEIIAVSKTVGPSAVRQAHAAGARLFGESRAQELVAKREALGDLELEWHFIGHLQSNKVRPVVQGCRLIHSVDRGDLARHIDERADPRAPQAVLVQVHTSGEATQSGVSPEALPGLLDSLAAFEHLTVEGLMTIGPPAGDERTIGAAFRLLRGLSERERAAGRPRQSLRHLSMGMSGDFEIAVAEGATLLRIGTALFGPRA